MSEQVILIALGAVSSAAVVTIVTTIVVVQRKEREQQERLARHRQRDAEERARIFAERRKRTPRRPSVPAPGRAGFRTDRDPVYNDTTAALMATGILFDHQPYDSGSRSDPSPSPSYDPSPSPSSDSGSSWSDGGGSSGGGGGDY